MLHIVDIFNKTVKKHGEYPDYLEEVDIEKERREKALYERMTGGSRKSQ